jgi:hypothetical protein
MFIYRLNTYLIITFPFSAQCITKVLKLQIDPTALIDQEKGHTQERSVTIKFRSEHIPSRNFTSEEFALKASKANEKSKFLIA